MHKKWLSEPYYIPAESGGGSGSSGTADVMGDAELLGEGDSDTDNIDESDSDDKSEDSEEESEENKDKKKDRESDFDDGEERSKEDEERGKRKGERDERNEKDDDEDEEDEDVKDTEDKEETEDEEVEQEFTVRALKNAFPEIFKKFPEVKDAIFRERMFTKMFGSVEEAEDAANKSAYFDQMSGELMNGRSDNLLKALKKNNEESLRVFASNFLPELFKTDKDLYHEINDHIISQVLHVVQDNAIRNGNKNLDYSVKYLSQFIFGNTDLPELKPLSKPKEKTEAEVELEKREANHERQKYSDFEESVHSRARNKLEGMVKEGFKDDKSMTDFVKDAITDRIIDKVGTVIAQDQFFQRQLASLWKKAVREGYTSEAKARITSAYLGRAKKIIPSIRTEVRRSATGKFQSQNNQNNGTSGNTQKRAATSSGSGSTKRPLPKDPRKIPSSMSDEDILASD